MAEKKAKKPETVYQIHNMVRRVETRLQRATAARRHPLKLLIGGGILRIPRGRYQTVAERMVRQLLPELRQMEAQGMLKVTTATGQRVELQNLKPVEELTAASPLPKTPLDSAKNDKTYEHGVGQSMPTVEGGKASSQDVKRPEILDDEVPEGFEEMTKSELYEEAKELDVEGRSSMNKEELVEAVEEAAEAQEDEAAAEKSSASRKKRKGKK